MIKIKELSKPDILELFNQYIKFAEKFYKYNNLEEVHKAYLKAIDLFNKFDDNLK
jgi:hypothetical protein